MDPGLGFQVVRIANTPSVVYNESARTKWWVLSQKLGGIGTSPVLTYVSDSMSEEGTKFLAFLCVALFDMI